MTPPVAVPGDTNSSDATDNKLCYNVADKFHETVNYSAAKTLSWRYAGTCLSSGY